jgi:hypothetical protein
MNRIPVSAARSLIRGRPPVAPGEWCGGSSGAIRDQSSSETRSLAMVVLLSADVPTPHGKSYACRLPKLLGNNKMCRVTSGRTIDGAFTDSIKRRYLTRKNGCVKRSYNRIKMNLLEKSTKRIVKKSYNIHKKLVNIRLVN